MLEKLLILHENVLTCNRRRENFTLILSINNWCWLWTVQSLMQNPLRISVTELSSVYTIEELKHGKFCKWCYIFKYLRNFSFFILKTSSCVWNLPQFFLLSFGTNVITFFSYHHTQYDTHSPLCLYTNTHIDNIAFRWHITSWGRSRRHYWTWGDNISIYLLLLSQPKRKKLKKFNQILRTWNKYKFYSIFLLFLTLSCLTNGLIHSYVHDNCDDMGR